METPWLTSSQETTVAISQQRCSSNFLIGVRFSVEWFNGRLFQNPKATFPLEVVQDFGLSREHRSRNSRDAWTIFLVKVRTLDTT